MIEPCTAQFS